MIISANIFLDAPRGIGIQALTSELSTVRINSSSGRSTTRSTPFSTTSEAPPSTREKQGILLFPWNLIILTSIFFVRHIWRSHQYNCKLRQSLSETRMGTFSISRRLFSRT